MASAGMDRRPAAMRRANCPLVCCGAIQALATGWMTLALRAPQGPRARLLAAAPADKRD
jgi:hypothetical protein